MKILSVDVEEWYHLLYPNPIADKKFKNLESRLDLGINLLLEIFQKYNVKATFFTLGCEAKKHPSLIKKIVHSGHEIASHGYSHELISIEPSDYFKSDVKKSIDILQQITGEKVISYRAPGFSITNKNLWFFEILLENGIQRDSSIVTGKSYHGGWPECNENMPFLIKANGKTIKEFPINTVNILGTRTIFGGGGYFRFFPYFLVKKWTTQSNYAMAYFHYRDFDRGQPRINNLGYFKKFRAYYGISHSLEKLHTYLNDFDFVDFNQADKIIDWSNVKTIDIQNYIAQK
ncbi:MAG: polysaccharide deacetylase family protein [Flavobacteriaceae bacterium]